MASDHNIYEYCNSEKEKQEKQKEINEPKISVDFKTSRKIAQSTTSFVIFGFCM